jgi:hypothetical protein
MYHTRHGNDHPRFAYYDTGRSKWNVTRVPLIAFCPEFQNLEKWFPITLLNWPPSKVKTRFPNSYSTKAGTRSCHEAPDFGVLTSGWLPTSAHALTCRWRTSESPKLHLHVVLAEILPVNVLKELEAELCEASGALQYHVPMP